MKVSARLRHIRALAEDKFVDVEFPVTVRFWADDITAALEQLSDCEMEISGPMHSYSIGFPREVKKTAEQQPLPAN